MSNSALTYKSTIFNIDQFTKKFESQNASPLLNSFLSFFHEGQQYDQLINHFYIGNRKINFEQKQLLLNIIQEISKIANSIYLETLHQISEILYLSLKQNAEIQINSLFEDFLEQSTLAQIQILKYLQLDDQKPRQFIPLTQFKNQYSETIIKHNINYTFHKEIKAILQKQQNELFLPIESGDLSSLLRYQTQVQNDQVICQLF